MYNKKAALEFGRRPSSASSSASLCSAVSGASSLGLTDPGGGSGQSIYFDE